MRTRSGGDYKLVDQSVHKSNYCERKDAEFRDLQIRLTNVEERCDDLEQYSRRNTVRIRGVAEALDEKTDSGVKQLPTRKLSIQVSDSDVVRSNRVGRRVQLSTVPRHAILCAPIGLVDECSSAPFRATRYHRALHNSQHEVFCDAICAFSSTRI